MGLKNLMSKSIKRPYKIYWIIINVLGFSIVFSMFFKLKFDFQSNGIHWGIPLYLDWIFNSIVFAGLQVLYFKILRADVSRRQWFLNTWIIKFSFQLLQMAVFIFLLPEMLRFSEFWSPDFYAIFSGGCIVLFQDNSKLTFFMSGLVGLGNGVILGIVIGKIQSNQIKNNVIANQWFRAVVISFGLGTLANSIILSALVLFLQIYPIVNFTFLGYIANGLLGLLYGILTLRIISNKIFYSRNHFFMEPSHPQ